MGEIWSFLVGLVALVLPGIASTPETTYYGYVEADYTYVAPVSAGVVETVDVAEGDRVVAGDLLFVQSTNSYQAALDAATAQVDAAEATLENLESGSRQEEIDVIAASLEEAKASFALAQTTYERSQRLFDSGVISQSKLDSDKTSYEAAQASVEQLTAQLNVAKLPARSAEISAAEANLRAARAEAVQAQIGLDDRQGFAPVAGIVEKVYFSPGEVVSAGSPVVALLPPKAVKVRFFVEEAKRGTLAIGDSFEITCDGCARPYPATLSFVAQEPQNTPPVIYSREERSRMVFMAEARFADAPNLLPGQPVTIAKVDAHE